MKKVSAHHRKGGGGKSTFVVCIGALAHVLGIKVLIIDLDQQRTALDWYNDRRGRDGPDVLFTTPDRLHEVLKQAEAAGYELIVIDTPGADSADLTPVYKLTDLAILVTRPSLPDARAAHRVLDALEDAGTPYSILLSQVPPGMTRRVQGWIDAYATLGNHCGAHLVYRLAYQDAIAKGLGVTEWEPGGLAAVEIRTVWHWLWDRLNGES